MPPAKSAAGSKHDRGDLPMTQWSSVYLIALFGLFLVAVSGAMLVAPRAIPADHHGFRPDQAWRRTLLGGRRPRLPVARETIDGGLMEGRPVDRSGNRGIRELRYILVYTAV